MSLLVTKRVGGFGKQLQVNRTAAAEKSPRLFAGEDKYGREQLAKGIVDFLHCALRGSTAGRIRRIAIHPVLCDVDVEAAEIDRAKLIECVIDLVEFVGGVGVATFRDHVLQPMKNPAIDERDSE